MKHYTEDEAAMIAAFKRWQEDEDYEAAQLQSLIDQGLWGLEGSVGRAMMRAIEDGRCILGPEAANDYWGNRIPAEWEIVDGATGTVQYAMKAEWESPDPDPEYEDTDEPDEAHA